jgi:hypothetical protein
MGRRRLLVMVRRRREVMVRRRREVMVRRRREVMVRRRREVMVRRRRWCLVVVIVTVLIFMLLFTLRRISSGRTPERVHRAAEEHETHRHPTALRNYSSFLLSFLLPFLLPFPWRELAGCRVRECMSFCCPKNWQPCPSSPQLDWRC